MFDQLTTYNTVMTLLFNHERYEDVLKIFEEFQEKEIGDYRYPRDLLSVYIAACYKINTPESYQKALEAMSGARDAGSGVLRKAVGIFAMLAFNHGHYDVALEALSLPKGTNMAIRNIRAMAMAKIGRIEDALAQLKFILNQDTAYKPVGGILQETITCIQAAIEENGSRELKLEFDRVLQALKDGNHLSSDTIDSQLLAPVEVRITQNDQGRQQSRGGQRFGFQGGDRYDSSNRHHQNDRNYHNNRVRMDANRGLMGME